MNLNHLAVIASPNASIDNVVRRMASESREVAHPGIAVVLDKKRVLQGIVTDGDIRRAYADNISFLEPISRIMVRDSIWLSAEEKTNRIASEVVKRVRKNDRHKAEWVRHIPLLDGKKRLVDIVDYLDVVNKSISNNNNIAIFGMGYVGLTLGVSLANRGNQVTGVEIDKNLVANLNSGLTHVHEPGLPDMLRNVLERDQIIFKSRIDDSSHNVYIIAVGTPLNSKSVPDLSYIRGVSETVALHLKHGDQVVLRSTVPVGTTREIIIPCLEKGSKLKAGKNFFVLFAPERTVEGQAMKELRMLPQVIGGYSGRCLKNGAEFWAQLTPSIIQVSSLEAAEIVKLANNSFRDLSFAFANEIALLADEYNIDAFRLIEAANEGYPRNPIPKPSPGVGGYCLTKDPILLCNNAQGKKGHPRLSKLGRAANERAAQYPVTVLKRFAAKNNIILSKIKVVVMGLAFKGVPETTDIRGSVSVSVINKIQSMVKNVKCWDAVVPRTVMVKAGINYVVNLSKGIKDAHVVLVLNNHPGNVRSEILQPSAKKRLIFDGWYQFDAAEIENVKGLTYATMGYSTENI